MVVIERETADTGVQEIIAGEDGRAYAERAEGGDVLLTVSCATRAHDRLIVDTELSREDAAHLLVQLVVAYGVDDSACDALWDMADTPLLQAMEEQGWSG